ncbi:hypothetical protein ACFQLX_23680 [Streptomyces polyrhachis]|uniref:DUF11 domain-containing protein n=1 Tax=Streptomyces polyrhachis TaxID=1282885 RepID=A0ABW2GPZ8_9ACTN
MHAPRIAAAVLAVSLTGIAAGPAAASARPAQGGDEKNARPPVVVEVVNHATELTPGSETTYTITVRNRTGEPLPRTVVTQLLPQPLTHLSSHPRARSAGREVVWRLPLPAHGSRSVTMTGRVGEIAGEDVESPGDGRLVRVAPTGETGTAGAGGPAQLATTVCVRAVDRGQLLTCSTASAPVAPAFWRGNRAYMAASAGAALVVGVVGVVLLRRWRLGSPGREARRAL